MKFKVRSWKLLLPLAALVAVISITTSISSAAPAANEIRVGIMTDCKGAFGFGYEPDIGGAEAGFAAYAHGKAKNPKKPSAGMSGITAGGKQIKIVGYGCGNDTVPLAVTETKRLMEQLKADVMIGPLSGDEAVSVANYAKAHPTKTVIIGTAGSQDPTLQIAPKNMFRYHGDGAMWNAGSGEIAYKKLKWRKAAIIMDDYSFGWTSAAGFIADFCVIGGQITKRVFPPLNTTDYAPFVRQLPAPKQANAYRAIMKKYYPKLPSDDGFVYNYYNAAWALVQGLQKSGGELGAKLQSSMPRTLKAAFQVSNGGVLHLDSHRQGIQDQ